MRLWRTSVVVGLLISVASHPTLGDGAGGPHTPDVHHPGPAFVSADSRDRSFVPLSEVGGRFGVVVIVTANNVNIVRRDGTMLRLRGAKPGDPTVTEEHRPLLIRDGEAWASSEEVARLLGLSDDWQVAGARPVSSHAVSEDGGSFETFAIAKPSISRPVKRSSTDAPRKRRMVRTDAPEAADGVSTMAAPAEIDLSIGRAFSFTDDALSGFWHEVVGPPPGMWRDLSRELQRRSPVSRRLASLALRAGDGDPLCAAGDVYDPLFGTVTGIELGSSLSEQTRLSAGVVVPSGRPGDRTDGTLSVRLRGSPSPSLIAEAAVGADGSYLLSGSWRRAGLHVRSSLADTTDGRLADLWYQQRLTPAVTLFARSARMDGPENSGASLAGVRWRLGSAHLAAERVRGRSGGEPWGTDAVSLTMVRSHLTAVLRWLAPTHGHGACGIEGSISHADSSGRHFFLSTSAPDTGSFGARRMYRVGGAVPLGRRLQVKAALDWGDGSAHPEAKIEWRQSPERVVTLRYGILFPDSLDLTRAADRAWVLQAAWAFGGPDEAGPRRGRVVGRVTDESGQPTPDVTVVLDGAERTLTGEDGRYEFSAVEIGSHSVSLDPHLLHADLAGGERVRTVYVTEHEPQGADFIVVRLCRIAGRVTVRSGSSVYEEALAGVAVALDTGQRTVTDSQGRYSFAGLRPGEYTVAPGSPDQIPDLTPVPPTSWSFNLRPGQEVSGADFSFQRDERPLFFGTLAAAQ